MIPALSAIPNAGLAPAQANPLPDGATPADRIDRMRAAARDLEASFLAEMLTAAGFGKPLESFGGGAGEEQFSSMLVAEQARAMAAAGGLGLSEHIFRAMMERHDAAA